MWLGNGFREMPRLHRSLQHFLLVSSFSFSPSILVDWFLDLSILRDAFQRNGRPPYSFSYYSKVIFVVAHQTFFSALIFIFIEYASFLIIIFCFHLVKRGPFTDVNIKLLVVKSLYFSEMGIQKVNILSQNSKIEDLKNELITVKLSYWLQVFQLVCFAFALRRKGVTKYLVNGFSLFVKVVKLLSQLSFYKGCKTAVSIDGEL